MSDPIMVFKKPSYPINNSLQEYLERFDRVSKVTVFYDDLLRFTGSVTVYDKNDQDTLWIRVYYNEFEREEIDLNLKKIYSLLHSDGNLGILKFLNICLSLVNESQRLIILFAIKRINGHDIRIFHES